MTGNFRVAYRRGLINEAEEYGVYPSFKTAQNAMDSAIHAWDGYDRKVTFMMFFDDVCIYRMVRESLLPKGRHSSVFRYSHDWGELSRKDAHYVVINGESDDIVKDCGIDLDSAVDSLDKGSTESIGFFTDKARRRKFVGNLLFVVSVFIFMVFFIIGYFISHTYVDKAASLIATVLCIPFIVYAVHWAYKDWRSKSYIHLNVMKIACPWMKQRKTRGTA